MESFAAPRTRTRAMVLAAVVAAGSVFAAGPGATRAWSSGAPAPAKLQVLRAGVQDGRLDVVAGITRRANGDRVGVEFIANRARSRFTARVQDGRIRLKRRLPASQRGMSTGIMEIGYKGNDRVRATDVRLRAANGKARLQRDLLSLHDRVVTAGGSLASGAQGVVRLILSYVRPDGTVGEWQGRARIRQDGRWGMQETLPADARAGGYVSMQFTGSYRPRLRGEQIAKQLLDGQSFGRKPVDPDSRPTAGTSPLVSTPPRVSPPVPVPTAPELPAIDLQPITAWRAPGSAPLSDAEAARRVRPAPEIRPQNAAANAYRPSAAEIQTFLTGQRDTHGRLPAEYNPALAKVTGNFTGTTDEILQWAAHKWGIPEDLARAVAVTESYWRQAGYGDRRTVSDPTLYPAQSRISGTSDVYESLGLMQIKWRPNGSVGTGTEPLRWKSTAFNADFWAASVRYYYDGACSWCGATYSAGQEKASIGAWYSPYPWANPDQQGYATKVWDHATKRTWTQPGF